jgi:hypothetical protein
MDARRVGPFDRLESEFGSEVPDLSDLLVRMKV